MFRRSVFLPVVGFLIGACAAPQQAPRMRTLSPEGPARYHVPVQLQVGWQPYEEKALVATGDHVWKATQTTSKSGQTPVLIVSYPDSSSTVSLRMDIDDALLGRLLKHTLMTQKPITSPLSQYLEEAACATCHPADVDLD